jgi:hypothetical protein
MMMNSTDLYQKIKVKGTIAPSALGWQKFKGIPTQGILYLMERSNVVKKMSDYLKKIVRIHVYT